MQKFVPNYKNILDAATNKEAARLPLYEHNISPLIMEQVLNTKFADLINGDDKDIQEFFKQYSRFFYEMGYDIVSYECCIIEILPFGGSLGKHAEPAIRDRADFEKYPWHEVENRFFDTYSRHFSALRDNMPAGMKAIGGVGNGIFECVQDVVGFMDLCYISIDDPELYSDLFQKMFEISYRIWDRFLKEYGDIYCVVRFGDDLGYKSNTLLPAADVKREIIPRYQKLVELVHSYNKPFLLHSCGCIFELMDDLINKVKIDAKHSNEDEIARFPVWVEKYGDRIGNFGGIDTDAVCRLTKPEMREYITDVVRQCEHHGGFAFGSGNSIPDYVPVEGYLNMVEILRELRGDFR
ncbi:MAG: uroporphyrinogen decarboxylase family protein [Acutalibacteraceae bacterium]